jgi:hypothetical protein
VRIITMRKAGTSITTIAITAINERFPAHTLK